MPSLSFDSLHRAHLRAQKGWYLRDSVEVPEGTLVWSDLISDPYWNYFSPSEFASDVSGGIGLLTDRGRSPALLLEPGAEARLNISGCTLLAKEAWMTATSVDWPDTDLKFMPVGDEQEMDLMVQLFRRCYGGGPEEPYGALPAEYGECLRRTLGRRDIWHLIAWLKGEPVGLGSVAIGNEVAILYNGGVVPEQRRKGFGSALARYRAASALAVGCSTVLLQTTDAGGPQAMLDKVGFQTRFVRRLYLPEA